MVLLSLDKECLTGWSSIIPDGNFSPSLLFSFVRRRDYNRGDQIFCQECSFFYINDLTFHVVTLKIAMRVSYDIIK